MNRIKDIIILGPNKKNKSGIVDYSYLIFKIFKQFSKNHNYSLIDITEIDSIERLLYSNNTILLVQIGTQDGEILRLLRDLKEKFPDLKRLIEIHDPETIVLSLFKFLDNAKNVLMKIIRRIIHLLFIKENIKKSLSIDDIIICKSKTAKNILINKYNLKNSIEIIPIPNYIDPPLAFCKSNTQISLGFFGFIDKSKGIHILIEALYRVRCLNNMQSIELTIAGGAFNKQSLKYKNHLIAMVNKFKLEDYVKFSDYLQNDIEIIKFIKRVDYIVLPYVNLNSGSSSGPFRWALSCGKPVIASDSKIFKELLNDNFLVSGNEVNNWADIFIKISKNKYFNECEIQDFINTSQIKHSWHTINTQYEKIITR